MSEEKNFMTAGDAAKILEMDKKKRADDCSKELQEMLTKHKCKLVPFMVLSADTPDKWGVNIVPE